MFEGTIEVGKKVTFHDMENHKFIEGKIHRILNKKQSEIKTKEGNIVIMNNKKLRTIKT
jgi:hypothetical protein